MLIINGFKLKSQDPLDIELILSEMKDVIKREAERTYRHLLEREIELLLDDIVLGVIERPQDITIYDLAVRELNRKVAYATGMQNETPYNYHVSVHVLYDDGNTYFKLNSNNNIYAKRLAKIKGLEDFSLITKGLEDTETKRQKEWEGLMSKYVNGVSPLGVQLFPDGPLDVKKDLLKFRSPSERAEERARYNLTSRYLSMVSMEEQIPNFRLMPKLDEAFNLLSTEEAKEELRAMKITLMQTLPNITLSLIETLPGEENGEGNTSEN